jgi:hypothetical protein
MALLNTNSRGLHALGMISLHTDMMQYYMQADGIPQFIVMMEDAQKKAKWARMPIANVKLVMMASAAVLAAQHFPHKIDDWEGLPATSCTWQAWKVAFCLAHLKRQCQLQALGGGKPLGDAHAVIPTAAPAKLTLNLLHQAMLNPRIIAWDFFQGPFDFNKTPLGPVGCRILTHAKPATRQSWDLRAKPGFYIGPDLDTYLCFKLVKTNTKSQVISDTVKFSHLYLSVPVPSAEDKIIHGLQVIVGAIRGAAPPTSVSQLEAITVLQEIFESWCVLAPPSLQPNHRLDPASPRLNAHDAPRVLSPSPLSTSPTWLPSTASRPPPQAAVTSLTPAPSAPTFHVTPRSLVFGNDQSPRVMSEPQQPLLPPAALVLPV